MQHAAEGAHLARGLGGGGDEGAALVLGEVEAAAFGVVELHAGLGLIETVHMSSVSQTGATKPRRGLNYPVIGAAEGARSRRS